jgi:diaminohydroxyphosphoribosylaminopyrimidine deaminase/5-amino-6-(5-phosphoribosylamino)uracil reductase
MAVRSLVIVGLAGVGTVLADDPMLNNRGADGRQPVRVVLDSQLRTPLGSKLVRTAREFGLVVVTSEVGLSLPAAGKRRAAGAELVAVELDGAGRLNLGAMLDELGRRQWTHLLVEGGPAVHRSFLDAGLADELLVFVSTQRVGQAGEFPRLDIAELERTMKLTLKEQAELAGDVMRRYWVRR